MDTPKFILIDDPLPQVRRITLNRPEKRNALSNALRGELYAALDAADADDAVRVTVLRGAGKGPPPLQGGEPLLDLPADERGGRDRGQDAGNQRRGVGRFGDFQCLVQRGDASLEPSRCM